VLQGYYEPASAEVAGGVGVGAPIPPTSLPSAPPATEVAGYLDEVRYADWFLQ